MKNQLYILLIFAVGSACFANSDPVISSVTVPPQRTDGSGIVDIYYTLSDADGDLCTVIIEVSDDGGGSYTIVPTSLSGDLTDVSSGRRHITWNSKTDLPEVFDNDYRVKVTADDGVVDGPDGMVWVYVKALDHGIQRLESLPLSLRLIREIHEKLMEGVRGDFATPGQLRKSQNWIGPGGCTLQNATCIPPPPDDVYYDKKPDKPKCDAKTVPCNIEQRFFREARITGYRLTKAA